MDEMLERLGGTPAAENKNTSKSPEGGGSKNKISDVKQMKFKGTLPKINTSTEHRPLLNELRHVGVQVDGQTTMPMSKILFGGSIYAYGVDQITETSKIEMEGMLNDLSNGKDHVIKFQAFAKQNEEKYDLCGVDFSVQVLTTGFWPKNVDLSLNLPKSMDNCVKAFIDYYQSATEARKLVFTESLGACTVQMKVNKKTYNLSITTLQAAVLDMFTANENGDAPTYSLEEVVAHLILQSRHFAMALLARDFESEKSLLSRNRTLGFLIKDFFRYCYNYDFQFYEA